MTTTRLSWAIVAWSFGLSFVRLILAEMKPWLERWRSQRAKKSIVDKFID